MKIAIIIATIALGACTSQVGNNDSDERVMQAAGAGVTVSSEEAFAAAQRSHEAKADEVKTKAATATVKVK